MNMKMYIDPNDLELLLERKRAYIGAPTSNAVDVINAVLLLYSAVTTNIDAGRTVQIIFKTTFSVFAAISIAQIVWRAYKTRSDNYTKDMLIRDIEALDMKERRSSIIAIQNPRNPRKYLVYYDPQWGFMLFPNYSTKNYENERSLEERLSKDLGTKASDIAVRFRDSGTEQKYATAHDEVRSYEYYFYSGDVQGINEDDFEIDGRKYQWMTIGELLNDPRTQKHNKYIVDHIKNSF